MSAADRLQGPPPPLPDDAHKGSAGRLLCVAGSASYPGAAILTLRAAQRAGAGLVTLGSLEPLLSTIVAPAVPEAVHLDLSGWRGAADSPLPEGLAGRADHARVVGPGLGAHAAARDLVRALLADDFAGPLVLDADGLNAVAGRLELVATSRASVVLTPHPGEAARLLGRPEIGSDPDERRSAAREISARADAVCCLKGHRTVVSAGGRVFENRTGNPGMATAGTGDVLAGILGAYLARLAAGGWEGATCFDAAAAAVAVHGAAGDHAAAALGRTSVVASDLIEFLPAAQRALSGDEEV
ncbi:MAG: NAD(P)H-hydrate dehydratase [Planctomycetota bacterium]|nr:NAD(P)H-hydrate dehydratase [Planctomycetota bacterium]MDP6761868.1 NAD(P)H-hydrate dehydratase [Planctomycetota bacterium]MDP6988803.1 NAD(P)H-hydrate dehydratase [Planctomycetota bacterium]